MCFGKIYHTDFIQNSPEKATFNSLRVNLDQYVTVVRLQPGHPFCSFKSHKSVYNQIIMGTLLGGLDNSQGAMDKILKRHFSKWKMDALSVLVSEKCVPDL